MLSSQLHGNTFLFNTNKEATHSSPNPNPASCKDIFLGQSKQDSDILTKAQKNKTADLPITITIPVNCDRKNLMVSFQPSRKSRKINKKAPLCFKVPEALCLDLLPQGKPITSPIMFWKIHRTKKTMKTLKTSSKTQNCLKQET